ncbi:MAG: TerC family protein [Planctomycetes bacterium]|nr:TerC family protein [Planctomycetota bacterium]HRV80080.1 TerC family protein [Planctomycetota bacterium]
MLELLTRPDAWVALATLITMEIVLGIDNLIFVSVFTNKLPEEQRPRARQIGIGLALILRLGFLTILTHLVGMTETVVDLGFQGSLDSHGEPSFETAFSWRDLILLAGGAFLMWKSTTEIHHKMDPQGGHSGPLAAPKVASFGAILAQIILLDIVFSIDSILTAIGMSDHLPIMITAVVVAVLVMFLAAGPVARFVASNPTVVMLALAFLLMIGMVLIADGLGRHVPKGYIYAAMGFSAFVEALNMAARRRAERRDEVPPAHP